jgi:uncharacterized membrane protein
MKSQRVVRGIAASAAAVLMAGAVDAVMLRAQTAGPETLIYAVYNGQNTATDVFKSMTSAQQSTGERIEAYAVVSKDLKGKVRVRDQRKTGAGVGAAIGGLIGLLGGPAGVAVGATAGGSVGYLTGDAVGIPRERVESMKQSLTPDSSALIVVLDDRWVQDVERSLDQAHARAVIANQIANSTN